MITVPELLAIVDSKLNVASDSELAAATRRQYVLEAVSEYGFERDRIVTTEVTGNGTALYAINAGSWPDFVDRFSTILAVEYPAEDVSDAGYQNMLEDVDFEFWRNAADMPFLRLERHTPTATETIRVWHTARFKWEQSGTTVTVEQAAHGLSVSDFVYKNDGGDWVNAGTAELGTHQVTVVSGDNITLDILKIEIPELDVFAVANLAASKCCRAIATKYARTNDSTIAADSVNHNSRFDNFMRLAGQYRKEYKVHMEGTGQSSDSGTAMFIDLDSEPAYPKGRRYLFHQRHTR